MFSQRPPVYHSHEVHCGPNTDAQPQGKWQVDIIRVCLVCMWESWVCKCLCKGSMHAKLEIQLTAVLILLHACPLLALRPKPWILGCDWIAIDRATPLATFKLSSSNSFFIFTQHTSLSFPLIIYYFIPCSQPFLPFYLPCCSCLLPHPFSAWCLTCFPLFPLLSH